MNEVAKEGLRFARHLRGGIWEVRIEAERKAFRVLFSSEGRAQQVLLALEAFIKKSIDGEAYFQRITPRKPRSTWSKRNREHAERLIAEGRMQEPGLVQVRAAKADGRWKNAYAASEMKVPADFLAAVERKPKAKQCFETLNRTNRYAIAYGLTTAKRPETRQRRFDKFLDMLIRASDEP